MKRLLIIFFLYIHVLSAQVNKVISYTDSLNGFNEKKLITELIEKGFNASSIKEITTSKKRVFIQNKYHLNHLITIPNKEPIVMAACNNTDFEDGDLTGWQACSGWHPDGPSAAYPAGGPCVNSGSILGRHTITSGTGTDACGGFPVVAPGGTYSLRLGNNSVNAEAERISQTFTVSSNNTNFFYRYAVVLEDPQHPANQQPYFEAVMYDQNGGVIPCSYYYVAAGQGVPGFQNSGNCASVIYKSWTPVFVDLSGYIGQNVTIQFTTADCSQGGHYGYAYIDADCSKFDITQTDTLCGTVAATLVAPDGGDSYLWGNGATTKNITVNAPGTYCVDITTVQGCNKQLCKTVLQYPKPLANYSSAIPNCNLNAAFTDSSTISSGSIVSWAWSLGDGNASTNEDVNHTYTTGGVYNVKLKVTSDNTCTDSIIKPISIAQKPIPDFIATAVCAGNTTSFTNQSAANPVITTWLWNFGEPSSGVNNSSNVANPTHTYAKGDSFAVKLVTITATGCKDSITKKIAVHPLTKSNFSATKVCLGGTTTFSDSTSISSGTISTWLWNFGEPSSGANNTSALQNPIHNYAAGGKYVVTLTTTSNNNCVNTKTDTVYVNPKPIALFSATNVCADTISLYNDLSTVSAGTIKKWSWDFGDNKTDTIKSPKHKYTTSGTYTVTVIVTSSEGCKDTATAAVTVYPTPVPNFTSTEVCLNTLTSFNNSSAIAPPDNINSWKWDFGDTTAVNTNQTPTHGYKKAGTFQVKLTAISNNNCTTTVTKPVIVNPLPDAKFSTNAVCDNDSTVLTNTSTISTGTITNWDWNFGDATANSAIKNPKHIYALPNTYTITLIATSDKGCKDTITNPTTVHPNPVAVFTQTDTVGCENLCIDFTDTSTVSLGTITKWEWNFGDGTKSLSKSPTKCYTSAGVYSINLKVTSDKGCRDSTLGNSTITIYPNPTAEFSTNPTTTTILNPVVDFTDLSSNDAIQWLWYFGDGDSLKPNQPNPRHTYPDEAEASYTARLIIENQYGCRDTVEHDIFVGTNWTFFVPDAFSPNGDNINDSFNGKGINLTNYDMMIFDRWGTLIFRSRSLTTPWDGKANNGTDMAQQDVYVYKISFNDVFGKPHRFVGHVTLVR